MPEQCTPKHENTKTRKHSKTQKHQNTKTPKNILKAKAIAYLCGRYTAMAP
jgi:hypothetical protein